MIQLSDVYINTTNFTVNVHLYIISVYVYSRIFELTREFSPKIDPCSILDFIRKGADVIDLIITD